MLTEEQLEILSRALTPLFNYLEQEVIASVAEHISESLSYTRTAELQAAAMRELGYSPAKIRSEAMKLIRADSDFRKKVALNTLKHKREVRRLLEQISKEAYNSSNEVLKSAGDLSWAADLSLWKEAGKSLTDASFLPQLVEAFVLQTAEELKNLTRTTGFKTMSGYEAIENLYQRELDKALIKVCTGTFSREKVIRDTIHSLAQSGLRSIDFASGYSMQLDTAVQLAVRTGCHQISAKVMDKNIEKTGENLIYVSKHWGARNKGEGIENHEKWQGKVYYIKQGQDYTEEAKRVGQDSIEDLWKVTGYSVDGTRESDPRGLHGYNCRHKHYVWFTGISELPDEAPEPAPVTIDGKTYDYYAMSQKMRSMERAVRALKREKEALGRLGMDTKETDTKIRQKTKEYEEFCKTCHVKENTARMRYECGTSDLKKTKAWKEFADSNTKNVTLTQNQEGSKIMTGRDTMSLEYQRYGRNKETLVNSTYIESGEYRNKFDNVSDNIDVSRVLYSKAKEMLYHRSGTMYEDMYWIDGKTGEVIASVLDEQAKEQITYSNSLKKVLQGKKDLISMHTHPQSMPPSIDDFNSAYHNGYSKGLVLCHDGKIFAYSSNQEVGKQLYLLHIGNYLDEGYTEYESQLKALEKIRENYDIDFWEVK